MSFKRHYHCGNLSLFSRATAVQSRPKESHKFTVNAAVFAPNQDGARNCERVYGRPSPSKIRSMSKGIEQRELVH